MKALVLTAVSRLELQDVPTPDCAADEVLIRVKACGICGSDVQGLDGSTGRRRPPIIMGHEAAGVIEQVGAAVQDWKPGDRVTFDSTVSCGHCWFCRRGQINLCDNRRVLGVSCAEYRRHGAFAEYVAVPRHILYRLPDDMTFPQAAMVEALSVAVHAVRRLPSPLGETIVVVGAGMIGLLTIQALRAAGSSQIIVVDLDASRLEQARLFGADHAFQPDQTDIVQEVLALTSGRGADLAVEAVGIAPTIRTAVACLRKGGALALVGNVSPEVPLPLQAVVTRELSLLGSCASSGEYPLCLDLIARGAVRVDPLISAVAPLAEGAVWFQRLRDKEPGLMKVVLQP